LPIFPLIPPTFIFGSLYYYAEMKSDGIHFSTSHSTSTSEVGETISDFDGKNDIVTAERIPLIINSGWKVLNKYPPSPNNNPPPLSNNSDNSNNNSCIQPHKLPPNWFFNWSNLLREPQPNQMMNYAAYQGIIYLTIEMDMCYPNLAAKLLGINIGNVRKYIAKLVELGILKEIEPSMAIKKREFIEVLRRSYNLYDEHIRKIRWYTLTDGAKMFFGQIPAEAVLNYSTFNKIKTFSRNFSEEYKEIRRETGKKIDEVIKSMIVREDKQGDFKDMEEVEYFMKNYCENRGLSYEIYKDVLLEKWKNHKVGGGDYG